MSTWSFESNGPLLLDATIATGRMEIEVGGTNTIEVTADNPDKITVDYSGSTLAIRQPRRIASGSVRVKAIIPVGSDVDVSVGAADVFVGAGCGDVAVQGGSGDVRVGDARRVRVAAASGDIRIASITEDVSVSGASGDVMVGDVGANLEVSVASGDVRVDRVGGSASVSTAAGDVRIRRFDGNAVEMRSLSGDIQIGLPSRIRVDADLKSMTGQISIPERDPSAAPPERSIRLEARTTTGDIRIERA